MDPYVKIICEGEKVQSATIGNNKNPSFGTKATFYRKKPDVPIIVEVNRTSQIIDLRDAHTGVIENNCSRITKMLLYIYGTNIRIKIYFCEEFWYLYLLF